MTLIKYASGKGYRLLAILF